MVDGPPFFLSERVPAGAESPALALREEGLERLRNGDFGGAYAAFCTCHKVGGVGSADALFLVATSLHLMGQSNYAEIWVRKHGDEGFTPAQHRLHTLAMCRWWLDERDDSKALAALPGLGSDQAGLARLYLAEGLCNLGRQEEARRLLDHPLDWGKWQSICEACKASLGNGRGWYGLNVDCPLEEFGIYAHWLGLRYHEPIRTRRRA